MAKTVSLRPKGTATKNRRWGLLNDNVEEHLPEMPEVQPLRTELQSLAGEITSLDNQQEETRSKLRDIVQRRREVERRGEVVRRRIEAHLRGTFGFTNEQLIKFGVKPRPRVIRRKKAQETPGQPAADTVKKAS